MMISGHWEASSYKSNSVCSPTSWHSHFNTSIMLKSSPIDWITFMSYPCASIFNSFTRTGSRLVKYDSGNTLTEIRVPCLGQWTTVSCRMHQSVSGRMPRASAKSRNEHRQLAKEFSGFHDMSLGASRCADRTCHENHGHDKKIQSSQFLKERPILF